MRTVQAQTDHLLREWASFGAGAAQTAAQGRMGDLAERRGQLEMALAETESALLVIEEAQVDTETVRTALSTRQALYAHLKPFEQQELMRLVLTRAEVSEHRLTLEIATGACTTLAQAPEVFSPGAPRFAPPVRLPALVPQSVFSLQFPLCLRSLQRRLQEQAQERRAGGRDLVAAEWRDLLESGVVTSRATLARLKGVSRARVTQVLSR